MNVNDYTQHRLMSRNCVPKVCRRSSERIVSAIEILLRIATVGNRNFLLPPAKLTLHLLTLKSATSNSAEYIYTVLSYYFWTKSNLSLPQIVVVLEVGDTANPSGLMSGSKSCALPPSLSCLIYLPLEAIRCIVP